MTIRLDFHAFVQNSENIAKAKVKYLLKHKSMDEMNFISSFTVVKVQKHGKKFSNKKQISSFFLSFSFSNGFNHEDLNSRDFFSLRDLSILRHYYYY